MSDTSVIFNILAKDNASPTLGRVGRTMSSLLTGVGFAAGNAAMGALGKAFDFTKNSVFGFNATLQNSQIAFTTMLGSGQKAKTFLNDLQQFAKTTPFEFPELVKSAQQMMGMGISAKDVIPDLTALGDSVASVGGSAEQVDQVTLAFDQMAAKGTLDMGNMNQLLQGGVPNALRILADSYHVTTGQMIDMISTGKVQSSQALPLLVQGLEHGTKSVKGLGGMMAQQSQTFTGALSNISDGLNQALAGAFKPFFDVASSMAQKLGDFFGGSKFANFGKNVSSGISGAITAIKGIDFKPVISGFDHIRSFVVNTLIPIIKDVGRTFGPIVKDIFKSLYESIGPVTGALKPVGGILKDVFGFISDHKTTFQGLAVGVLAIAGAMKAWRLATEAWSAVTKIAAGVQAAFNLVMDANPIGLIILAIVGLVAAFVYLWTHSKAFRDFFIGIWNHIKEAAKAVADWFSGPFVNFFKAAGSAIAEPFLWLWHNVLDPAWHAIVGGFDFVKNIVVSFADLWKFVFEKTIGAVVLWLWHSVFEPAAKGIAAVATWLFDNAVKPVFSGISSAIRGAGDVATWLWHNAIEPAMKGVGSAIQTVWKNVISPAFGFIKDGVKTVGSVIQGIFSKVGGWISSAFSGAAGIVKGAMNAVIGVINGAISGINSVIGLANKVPGVNFPRLPNIPRLASGGVITTGGLVQVGEHGAEVVSLPTGAAVYPHGTSPGGSGTSAGELRISGNADSAFATFLKNTYRVGLWGLYDSAGQRVQMA